MVRVAWLDVVLAGASGGKSHGGECACQVSLSSDRTAFDVTDDAVGIGKVVAILAKREAFALGVGAKHVTEAGPVVVELGLP